MMKTTQVRRAVSASVQRFSDIAIGHIRSVNSLVEVNKNGGMVSWISAHYRSVFVFWANKLGAIPYFRIQMPIRL